MIELRFFGGLNVDETAEGLVVFPQTVMRDWRLAQAWLARAHPVGSPLAVHGEDGKRIAGTFDGLGPDGSLRLRVADGELRTIHAGDVTLG